MSLAMQRLKNIGWFALVFLVAILLYPLSLNVAAMHSDLVNVDNKILNTKREISYLQADLRTRASLQQLEEWNALLYGYQPPTVAQFVDGETALAGISGADPVTKPVMVAASAQDGVAPAGIIGKSPFASIASIEKHDDDVKPVEIAMANTVKQESKAVPATRTEKLAHIDAQLLSDDFLSDINKRAAKERKSR